MEAILVDALENQILHGSARAALTRGNRFACWRGISAEILAEPVTLSSIYGRALFLAPLLPKDCFLTGHSAAWVWAGQGLPPETLYIASARRPLRAADSRFWVHLDAPSRRRLAKRGIKTLGTHREKSCPPIPLSAGQGGKNQTDFLRLGKVQLFSPQAALDFCKRHPGLPGGDSWNRTRLLKLASQLLS